MPVLAMDHHLSIINFPIGKIQEHPFFNTKTLYFIDSSVKKPLIDEQPSKIYDGLMLPKAPQFHPYNFIPYHNNIAICLPLEKITLPNPINMFLQKIEHNSIDFFIIVQKNTLEKNTHLLYRPNYYTDSSLTESYGNYNKSWDTRIHLFNLLPEESIEINKQAYPWNPILSLKKTKNTGNDFTYLATTHPGEANQIIVSPNFEGGAVALCGLENENQNTAFWTTTIVRDSPQANIQKVAVTLHLLLNKEEVSQIDNHIDNFQLNIKNVAKYLDNKFFGSLIQNILNIKPYDINFAEEQLQDGIENIKGISHHEPWGRWSNAKNVVIDFKYPLPKSFNLEIEASALGPNIDKYFSIVVGEEINTYKFPDGNINTFFIDFKNNNKHSRSITIEVPAPITPLQLGINTDIRTLGIGLRKLKIHPQH